MALYNLLILALIQGVTEFLPVSSSAHLVLYARLSGAPDQGVMIDVAVHVGTLCAVILAFRGDVAKAILGLGDIVRGRWQSHRSRLAQALALATVPVAGAGLVLHETGAVDALRSVAVIGWAMLGFGLLLFWADRTGRNAHEPGETAFRSIRHAAILGLWQALALIPGTSRSGICITGARFLGYERQDAARVAMLMSIPTIAASGALVAADATFAGDSRFFRDAALVAVLSFAAAWIALKAMMRLLRSVSFAPYVIYRVVLGIVLLAYAYS